MFRVCVRISPLEWVHVSLMTTIIIVQKDYVIGGFSCNAF